MSHPLIVLSAFALCIPVLPRLWRSGDTSAVAVRGVSNRPEPRRRVIPERDALLLLALVLLLRCVLDTWDTVYYPLPFVLALLTWETLAFRRPAIISLSSTVLVWVSCEWLPSFASADAQAAFFLAWTLPLAIWLSWTFYARGRISVDERERLGQSRKPLRAIVLDHGKILDTYTQAPG